MAPKERHFPPQTSQPATSQRASEPPPNRCGRNVQYHRQALTWARIFLSTNAEKQGSWRNERAGMASVGRRVAAGMQGRGGWENAVVRALA